MALATGGPAFALPETTCPRELVRPAVAVVNPYSAGARLAPVFARREVPVYYVLSGHEPDALLKGSFRPDTFKEGYRLPSPYGADKKRRPAVELARERAALRDWLRTRGVTHVLAGAEGSAALADELSETMELATSNGTALSNAREDKVAMGARFGAAALGLKTIPTVLAPDYALARESAKRWLGFGAVVVKPAHSAGTDDVFVCTTEGEVEDAIRRIVGKENLLGKVNYAAVVQPFIHGTEYNIDVVVSNGVARIAWIWRYTLVPSPTSAHVVQQVDLIDPRSEEAQRIGSVPQLAARALGINWGPLHLELFVTKGGEVVLLEGGARVGGVLGPPTAAATDTDIFELVADAYLDPLGFARSGGRPYELKKHARIVALNNFHKDREIYRPHPSVEDSPERMLRGLPTFFDLSLHHAHQTAAPITGSIKTALGFLQLVDESAANLDRDTDQVRRWEKSDTGFLARPKRGKPVTPRVAVPAS